MVGECYVPATSFGVLIKLSKLNDAVIWSSIHENPIDELVNETNVYNQ